MFAAFKERRPWAAALISFVFTPFIGMFYLNRWRTAVGYLAVTIAIFAVAPVIFGLTAMKSSDFHYWLVILPIRTVGAFHSYHIARNRSSDEIMRWYSRWYVAVLIVLILSGSAFALRTFFYQPFDATSGSMNPTLNIGDAFLASKSAYNAAAPQRGQVVVFFVPHKQGVQYVKRIIGIPGDRVQFLNGVVRINGVPAQLRLLRTNSENCEGSEQVCATATRKHETLPGSSPHLIQRVDFASPYADTLVYTVPANSYFVVGDNRDNSMDSRMDEIGFVPASAIVGRVTTKYFDGTKRRWTWETVN
jgi:signal peptidase I